MAPRSYIQSILYEESSSSQHREPRNDSRVNGDIDNDGYLNDNDQFPYDPNEWIDSDGDGIPDNTDIDDDDDGILDFRVNWSVFI